MEARILELQARLHAAIARINGMIAENALRALQGASPAYSVEAFEEQALNFEHIAEAVRQTLSASE